MTRPFSVFVAIWLLIASHDAAAEWAGKEIVDGGTRVVVNPETPAEGTVRAELEEVWRAGGFDDDALFGVISQLVEDPQGNVYLLDSQLSEIPIYSPAGEFVRTIGREGEGPGEFRNASDMYLGPGGLLGVLQVFPGKIVQLTPQGDPAGNFPLPELDGGGFQLVFVARGLPDRVVLAGAVSGQSEQTNYLRALDAGGKELARFHEETNEMRFGGMKFQEKTNRNFVRRWAVAPDGRVAAALDFDAYEIHVWNPDGSLDRVISRPDYRSIERTDQERKTIKRLFEGFTRWNPGSTYEESETHQAVNQLAFREDGSLWVLPGSGQWRREPGVFASYDVYDREGRYVRQVELEGEGDPFYDGLFFTKQHVYVVTDLLNAVVANTGGGDEDAVDEEVEPVTVIANRLNIPDLGRR